MRPDTLETAKQIIEMAVLIAGGVAVVIAAFITSRKKYQNGDVVAENNLIMNLRTQIKGYEDVVAKLQIDLTAMSKQISNIEGQLAAKDQQLKLFKEIIDGRDPKAQEFQQIMLNSVKEYSEDRKIMQDVFGKILHSLGMIDGHLSAGGNAPTEMKIEGSIKPA